MTDTFGASLRAARLNAGLSQLQLAIGIMSVSHLSLLERDLRQPSTETLQALTERLGEHGAGLLHFNETRARPVDRLPRALRAILCGDFSEAEHLATLAIFDAGNRERRERALCVRAQAREHLHRPGAALDDLNLALDSAQKRQDQRAKAKIAIECARLRMQLVPTFAA